jgi:phosphate/sulfate permease
VIYDIYLNGTLSTKLQPQMWCLVISALSLVVGLATYGYNVCRWAPQSFIETEAATLVQYAYLLANLFCVVVAIVCPDPQHMSLESG